MLRNVIVAAAAGALLSGCITAPRQPAPSSDRAPGAGGVERGDEPTAGATTALLLQARSDRAAGALASAESAIERALRIAPSDPWLWIELGQIKRAAGDVSQAAAMGRKALTLTAGDRAAEASATALLR